MPVPIVTVVVPTLAADDALAECLRSLENQSMRDFEAIVVDNSGQGLARRHRLPAMVSVIENQTNVGFGAAINQGSKRSKAVYVATLNDDAIAQPGWLSALVAAAETDRAVGMCASEVRLAGRDALDSAGMVVGGDGSSKQRGHGENPEQYSAPREALCPSGSAALYRREMLEQVGGFDEDFFLYCEDTDLGLRARWAGWKCLYVPQAIVHHDYSHSAGKASALKAYYVERNRLYVALKNFPALMLLAAPFVTVARYFWHAVAVIRGRGIAGEFHRQGNGLSLAWFVVKAHLAALRVLPALLRKRRLIRAHAKITGADFARLIRSHYISARQVAAL